MYYLFGSEMPTFPVRFRDYIQMKFGQTLIFKEVIDKHGMSLIGVFIEENNPYFNEIVAEKDQFLRAPFDVRYEDASWKVGEVHEVVLKSPDMNWSFLNRAGKTTLFLTALCLIIYVLQLVGFEPEIMDALHYPADDTQDLELWRYVTHALVHLSPLHILFNLSWFWIFGSMIERVFGSIKLLLLCLVAALVSGYVQNYFSGPDFFGLSGVVYAVLGYVFVVNKFNDTFLSLPNGFFAMLVIGILLGFISPFFGVYMGNAAHISGLVVGLIWGYWDRDRALRPLDEL